MSSSKESREADVFDACDESDASVTSPVDILKTLESLAKDVAKLKHNFTVMRSKIARLESRAAEPLDDYVIKLLLERRLGSGNVD